MEVVESMLADAVIVDNATAGLAMKAYTILGLKGQWRSVSTFFSLSFHLLRIFCSSREGKEG